ncbi:MAG TPA: response regulator [Spirochaetota bacterium]|nr:response regulator [Spirochaetota bacterium]HPS86824.1 response regulator [Spirochaetota bacterium]
MSKNNEQSILVVDDDILVRKVLKKYISNLGYYVDTAEDGRGALDMLGSFSYDLVLTDLQMPRLGGIELLKKMFLDYPDIPKIVLTGQGTNDDIIAALKSGAYDFLYKPIDDFEILEFSIKRAVESKKLKEDKERHLAELEKINEIISMLNSGKSTEEIFSKLHFSLKRVIPFDGMILTLLNETNTFLNIENMVFNQSHFYTFLRKGDRFFISELSIKQLIVGDIDLLNIEDLGLYLKSNKMHEVFNEINRNGINSILAVSLVLKNQIRGIIFFLSGHKSFFKNHHITFVRSIVGQIALSVQRAELMKEIENHSKNLEKMVSQRTEEVMKTQRATIFALSSLADARDSETGDHLERIRNYSVLLMQLYKLEEDHPEINSRILRDLYDSSVLHDIGKVGIPDYILLKKGFLTDEEFKVMKKHPVIGYDALRNASGDLGSDFFLNMAMDVILYHHERWDGAGYPYGLKGEDIPLSARIVSIADVYDALTSRRPYKEAFSHDKAIDIMKNEDGKYDPELFNLFIKNAEKFNKIRIEFSEEQNGGES